MVNMIVNNICVPAPSAVWRALSACELSKVLPHPIVLVALSQYVSSSPSVLARACTQSRR